MPNEESWLNKVFFASDNSVNKVSGKNKEVASNSSGAQNAEFVFEFENDDSYDTVIIHDSLPLVNHKKLNMFVKILFNMVRKSILFASSAARTGMTPRDTPF